MRLRRQSLGFDHPGRQTLVSLMITQVTPAAIELLACPSERSPHFYRCLCEKWRTHCMLGHFQLNLWKHLTLVSDPVAHTEHFASR